MAKGGPKENPQITLKRLASKRVTKATKAVRLVGNLARYKPTEAQENAIIGALKEAVKNVEAQFAGNVGGAEGFKLS